MACNAYSKVPLTDDDRRGLTALFWSNINPYDTFRRDIGQRLELDSGPTVPAGVV